MKIRQLNINEEMWDLIKDDPNTNGMSKEEFERKVNFERQCSITHIQYFLDNTGLTRENELKILRYLEKYDDMSIERGDILDNNIFEAITAYFIEFGEKVAVLPNSNAYMGWKWGDYTLKLYIKDGVWYEILKGKRTIYNTL